MIQNQLVTEWERGENGEPDKAVMRWVTPLGFQVPERGERFYRLHKDISDGMALVLSFQDKIRNLLENEFQLVYNEIEDNLNNMKEEEETQVTKKFPMVTILKSLSGSWVMENKIN